MASARAGEKDRPLIATGLAVRYRESASGIRYAMKGDEKPERRSSEEDGNRSVLTSYLPGPMLA
jgi:hypothetical protein